MTEQQRKQMILDNPEYIPKNSPSNYVDLTGKDYPYFKVLYRVKNRSKWKVSYLCECKCSEHNLFIATADNIRSGNTNSCGCYGKQKTIEASKKYNKYDLSGEYGIGYTYQGEEFYFDLEDYDKIKDYCWSIGKKDDVEARVNSKLVKMHRLIMGVTDPKIVVDHIYHNENGAGRRYDNRKCNLRVCEQKYNACNARIRSNNTSGVTGVEYDKRRNTWSARIKYCKKEYYLGAFKNKEDAIQARKQKEKELFGEYQYKEYIGDINNV